MDYQPMQSQPQITATQKMQMIVKEVHADSRFQETQKMKSTEQVIIKGLKSKCQIHPNFLKQLNQGLSLD